MAFEKGRKKTGGRKKGTKDKFTTIKDSFLQVFRELNPDGMEHLRAFAEAEPKEFYKLAAKLMPKEVNETITMTVHSSDVPDRPQKIEEWLEREPIYMASASGSATEGN